MYKMGIDVGSTTVKVVVMDDKNNILFKDYRRHKARVRETLIDVLGEIQPKFTGSQMKVSLTGSAGMGIAQAAGFAFSQEVFATTTAVKKLLPTTDVVVELGGEDAKLIFLGNSIEQRMNGSCAGGTGAFIDQIASLMNVQTEEMNGLAANHTKIYPIASRCGVFAKTDVQPLLNQGARKEDIAASVYQAIVNQTIGGLAQGRKIKGNVAFLGGPLTFMPELRKRFQVTLELTDAQMFTPEDSQFFIAFGCAFEAESTSKVLNFDDILTTIKSTNDASGATNRLDPLFKNEQDLEAFRSRHASATVEEADINTYTGDAYLGVDAGSTTTKIILLSEDNKILFNFYASNKGNPVDSIREQLINLRKLCGNRINIKSACATGYGEELIQKAFGVDNGQVETIAHYKAAAFFKPNVDFIIDIGGQDMKSFKVKNGLIDSITLNEACSSGCGSFIQSFATSMGWEIKDFAIEGLKATAPVDLGTKCTVFMNSMVKQAQKENASVADIASGLAISVVKNALYKVIRISDPKDLGENIVVQGGTFFNDGVLRAFENELGFEVIRPVIAGSMGAFGCALIAKDKAKDGSKLLTLEQLENFVHKTSTGNCRLCGNNCTLTINEFSNGSRLVSGNKCEKGAGIRIEGEKAPNMIEYKYNKLRSYVGKPGPLGKIGLPFALNIYELLPFWHTYLTELGFEVVHSAHSSQMLYQKGQDTIPSDTVCYPAKLVHGHIVDLVEKGLDKIFYPVMPYNLKNENHADNSYNCPVVAYYPELVQANMDILKERNVQLMNPYFGIHRIKDFKGKLNEYFMANFGVSAKLSDKAYDIAMLEFEKHLKDIVIHGQMAIQYAKTHGLKTVIVSGRPYHVDPEVHHGLDKMIQSLNLVLVTEDAVAPLGNAGRVSVLNQWTYHTRLYDAAQWVTTQKDTELVQLVSFSCGIDAITTDEVKKILETKGKFYTQLKIDEISNLGAVKIRMRSLIAAMDEKEAQKNG